jgi:hypothetical protein
MNEPDTVGTMLRIPHDVREWLKATARYNTSSMQAEIIRSIRDRMESERRTLKRA